MAASYVLESNNALILFWIIALQCFIKHKKDNNAGECLIMKTIQMQMIYLIYSEFVLLWIDVDSTHDEVHAEVADVAGEVCLKLTILWIILTAHLDLNFHLHHCIEVADTASKFYSRLIVFRIMW
jgi:hypothetical protein